MCGVRLWFFMTPHVTASTRRIVTCTHFSPKWNGPGHPSEKPPVPVGDLAKKDGLAIHSSLGVASGNRICWVKLATDPFKVPKPTQGRDSAPEKCKQVIDREFPAEAAGQCRQTGAVVDETHPESRKSLRFASKARIWAFTSRKKM